MMTWYKIYRKLCSELNIMFPLQQKNLCVRVNPIPNTLEFQIRNMDKTRTQDEINNNLNNRAKAYYAICKLIGFDELQQLSKNKKTFKLRSSEHPDRHVNLHTVISVLYLSGFRNDELVSRAIDYLKK